MVESVVGEGTGAVADLARVAVFRRRAEAPVDSADLAEQAATVGAVAVVQWLEFS